MTCTQEEEALRERGFQLVKDLRPFGLACAIYSFARKPVEDNTVYEMKTLDMFDWMDRRLIKCLQTYNLTTKDVFDMRWAYEELLPYDAKLSNTISVEDIYRGLVGVPKWCSGLLLMRCCRDCNTYKSASGLSVH